MISVMTNLTTARLEGQDNFMRILSNTHLETIRQTVLTDPGAGRSQENAIGPVF